MTADWENTGPGGAVSAELLITYAYTGTDSGSLVTQHLFAGQQVTAPATSYTTAGGAIDPALPAAHGVTIRGAYLIGNSYGLPGAEVVTLGSALSTGACTASNSSSTNAALEMTRAKFVKDVTATVVSSDAQTYTACYSSATNQILGGVLTVTYQSTS